MISIVKAGFRGQICSNRIWAASLKSSTRRFISTTRVSYAPKIQSVSPLAPIGVEAATQAASDSSVVPKPKIFDEFALTDRVAIVSGGNRGLGLEMALALCEAGSRAVYCFDLPKEPSEEWRNTSKFVSRLGNNSRLEYVSVDVTKQQDVWACGEEIGDREGGPLRFNKWSVHSATSRANGLLYCRSRDSQGPHRLFGVSRGTIPRGRASLNNISLSTPGPLGKYEWRAVHCPGCRSSNASIRQ